jgi:hypothetical protein
LDWLRHKNTLFIALLRRNAGMAGRMQNLLVRVYLRLLINRGYHRWSFAFYCIALQLHKSAAGYDIQATST